MLMLIFFFKDLNEGPCIKPLEVGAQGPSISCGDWPKLFREHEYSVNNECILCFT